MLHMWPPQTCHHQMTQGIRQWNRGCFVVTVDSAGLMDQWRGTAAQGAKVWEGGCGDEAETICFANLLWLYVFKEDLFLFFFLNNQPDTLILFCYKSFITQ
jgi:hypothetical protein